MCVNCSCRCPVLELVPIDIWLTGTSTFISGSVTLADLAARGADAIAASAIAATASRAKLRRERIITIKKHFFLRLQAAAYNEANCGRSCGMSAGLRRRAGT